MLGEAEAKARAWPEADAKIPQMQRAETRKGRFRATEQRPAVHQMQNAANQHRDPALGTGGAKESLWDEFSEILWQLLVSVSLRSIHGEGAVLL